MLFPTIHRSGAGNAPAWAAKNAFKLFSPRKLGPETCKIRVQGKDLGLGQERGYETQPLLVRVKTAELGKIAGHFELVSKGKCSLRSQVSQNRSFVRGVHFSHIPSAAM
jgi:hypothetical protein